MPLVAGSLNIGACDVRGKGGGFFTTRRVTIAASMTINKNDVIGKTSGADTFEQFIALPNAGTSTLDGGSALPAGIALEAITTNASGVDTNQNNKTTILIAVWDPQCEFCLPCLAQGTATANTSYTAITAANSQPQDFAYKTLYRLGRLQTSGGGSTYFLSSNSTNGCVKKVAVLGGDANIAVGYWPVWIGCPLTEANIGL